MAVETGPQTPRRSLPQETFGISPEKSLRFARQVALQIAVGFGSQIN
jgi:hypothetical protein